MKKFAETFGQKLTSEIFRKFLDAYVPNSEFRTYALNHGCSGNKPESVIYWFEDILNEICPNPEELNSKLFKGFECWNTFPFNDGEGVAVSYSYKNEEWTPGGNEPYTWSTRPWCISFEEMHQFLEEKK